MECILFKQKNPDFAHFICIAGEGSHFLIGSEGGKSVCKFSFLQILDRLAPRVRIDQGQYSLACSLLSVIENRAQHYFGSGGSGAVTVSWGTVVCAIGIPTSHPCPRRSFARAPTHSRY